VTWPIPIETDIARRAADRHRDLRVGIQVGSACCQGGVAVNRPILGGQFGDLLTVDEGALLPAFGLQVDRGRFHGYRFRGRADGQLKVHADAIVCVQNDSFSFLRFETLRGAFHIVTADLNIREDVLAGLIGGSGFGHSCCRVGDGNGHVRNDSARGIHNGPHDGRRLLPKRLERDAQDYRHKSDDMSLSKPFRQRGDISKKQRIE
jgi:hypothetical protein